MPSTPAGREQQRWSLQTPQSSPQMRGPLGLASAPPGKWFLYLTMPVAMEMIRTEQEGIG